MDLTKVDNVVVENIDTKDAPDFVDASIASADYDGEEMNEAQLEELNKDSDFVYQCTLNQLY